MRHMMRVMRLHMGKMNYLDFYKRDSVNSNFSFHLHCAAIYLE